jgi:hypothetical protein
MPARRLDENDRLRILGLLRASTPFDEYEGAGLCVAWLKSSVERWNRHGEGLHFAGAAEPNTGGPPRLWLRDHDERLQDLPATRTGSGDVKGDRLTVGCQHARVGDLHGRFGPGCGIDLRTGERDQERGHHSRDDADRREKPTMVVVHGNPPSYASSDPF